MQFKSTSVALAAILSMLSLVGVPQRSNAQTYPIDCAILLCLSGGWPASVPCARARAEFIRRITPWPVEPPLQIWRCPMGASFNPDSGRNSEPEIYDALLGGTSPLPQSFPKLSHEEALASLLPCCTLESPLSRSYPMGSHYASSRIAPISTSADLSSTSYARSVSLMSDTHDRANPVPRETASVPRISYLGHMEPRASFLGQDLRLRLYRMRMSGSSAGVTTAPAFTIDRFSLIGGTTKATMVSSKLTTESLDT